MTYNEKFPLNEFKLEIRKYGGKLWLFIYNLHTDANRLAKPLSTLNYEVDDEFIHITQKSTQ